MGYADKNEKYWDEDVMSITIINEEGIKVKVIYVTPNFEIKSGVKVRTLENGMKVNRGDLIGVAPDMRVRFQGTEREIQRYNENMTNHVHMEIILPDNTYTDRAQLILVD